MRLLRVGDGPPPGRDRRGTMTTGMGCHGARIPAPGLHLSLLLLAQLRVLLLFVKELPVLTLVFLQLQMLPHTIGLCQLVQQSRLVVEQIVLQ